MFADAITDPATQEGAAFPWGWVVLAVVAVLVLAATVWVVRGLHRAPAGGRSVRDVLSRAAATVRAGRARRAAAARAPLPQPAPPAPGPVEPPQEAPPSAPAPVEAASLSTASALKGLVIAASVPSLFSLVWTVWTLIDMLTAPLPAALAAGLVMDVALVAAVAMGFLVPARATAAKTAGWIIACLAAVIVGWHSMSLMTVLVLLGAIPLVAKGLWHLAIDAYLAQLRQVADRRAQKEAEEKAQREREAEEARQREEAERAAEEERRRREAELSTELDHQQQVLIAKKKKEAAFARQMAAAELELEQAQSEAEHLAALAKIARLGEQQRAMDEEDAKVEKARQQLRREIRAGQSVFAMEASGVVRRALGGAADAPTTRPDGPTDEDPDPTDGPDGPGGGAPAPEEVWIPEPTDALWERHGQPTPRPTADPTPVGQSAPTRPAADTPPFLLPDTDPTPDPAPADTPTPVVDVPRDDADRLARVHQLVLAGELPLVLTPGQRAAGQTVPDRPSAEALRAAVGCGQARSRRLRDAYPDYAAGLYRTSGAA